ncbi:ABC transporter permease [Limnohabitans sp.]|uniref:ABC transporter permease n=1 Tax=Limnohabitans sp. TaxID=1907725 RepID=UPI0037C0760F
MHQNPWRKAARAVGRRAWGMLLVLALVSVLVFVLTRAAAGDPMAVLLGDSATEQDILQARALYGLDQSLWVQYLYWLGQLLQGNLGQSIFLQIPVTTALWERAEPTFWLALMSLAVAVAIGVPSGMAAAVWRGSWLDQMVSALAMVGTSLPSFWAGLLLIQLFAVHLGWFPASGYGSPDALLLERLHHLVLPAIVLGTLNSALITRFTRASMLDILGEDYIRTARSKGLPESRVVLKHALRNALVPLLTVVGLTLALLIGGAVVTETVFNLPGLGNLVVRAVLRRDYPVIQGALLVIAGIYVLINFSVDMLYVLVDPRLRHG